MTPRAFHFRPTLERLDIRLTPDATPTDWVSNWAVALAAEDGGSSNVTLFDRNGGSHTIPVFDPQFTGGVRYAVGDVTGDGADDLIVAAGPGGGPHVKVLDGKTGTLVRSFFAYNPAFSGGVELAVGDVDRDGYDDIITGAGAGGGPHVRVFSGKTGAIVSEFMAFSSGFSGGVFVAGGDLNRDGYDDIITGAGAGAEPRVIARDGHTGAELTSFLPFESNFRGGVRVASADVTGDGIDEVIAAAGPGGGPRVRTFDVTTGQTVSDRFVADTSVTSGVRLSTTDLSRDGTADLVAKTRTGNVVSARVYGLNGYDTDYRVWVGSGAAPSDFTNILNAQIPYLMGSSLPTGDISGIIESVSSDGSAMTLRRGDGAPVTVDLNGEDPPPPGMVYIEGYLPPADLLLGDTALSARDLPVGRWVKVTAARLYDASATSVMASRVRVY